MVSATSLESRAVWPQVPIVQTALHALPEAKRVSFEELFPETRAEAMELAVLEAAAREDHAKGQLEAALSIRSDILPHQVASPMSPQPTSGFFTQPHAPGTRGRSPSPCRGLEPPQGLCIPRLASAQLHQASSSPSLYQDQLQPPWQRKSYHHLDRHQAYEEEQQLCSSHYNHREPPLKPFPCSRLTAEFTQTSAHESNSSTSSRCRAFSPEFGHPGISIPPASPLSPMRGVELVHTCYLGSAQRPQSPGPRFPCQEMPVSPLLAMHDESGGSTILTNPFRHSTSLPGLGTQAGSHQERSSRPSLLPGVNRVPDLGLPSLPRSSSSFSSGRRPALPPWRGQHAPVEQTAIYMTLSTSSVGHSPLSALCGDIPLVVPPVPLSAAPQTNPIAQLVPDPFEPTSSFLPDSISHQVPEPVVPNPVRICRPRSKTPRQCALGPTESPQGLARKSGESRTKQYASPRAPSLPVGPSPSSSPSMPATRSKVAADNAVMCQRTCQTPEEPKPSGSRHRPPVSSGAPKKRPPSSLTGLLPIPMEHPYAQYYKLQGTFADLKVQVQKLHTQLAEVKLLPDKAGAGDKDGKLQSLMEHTQVVRMLLDEAYGLPDFASQVKDR